MSYNSSPTNPYVAWRPNAATIKFFHDLRDRRIAEAAGENVVRITDTPPPAPAAPRYGNSFTQYAIVAEPAPRTPSATAPPRGDKRKPAPKKRVKRAKTGNGDAAPLERKKKKKNVKYTRKVRI